MDKNLLRVVKIFFKIGLCAFQRWIFFTSPIAIKAMKGYQPQTASPLFDAFPALLQ
jgi:hypothetical protein